MSNNAADVHETMDDLIDDYIDDLMEISDLFDQVEETLSEGDSTVDPSTEYDSDDETVSVHSVDSTRSHGTAWSTTTTVVDFQQQPANPIHYLPPGVTPTQDLAARMVAMIFVAEELQWKWSRFNAIVDFLCFRRWLPQSFMERMRGVCVPDEVSEDD